MDTVYSLARPNRALFGTNVENNETVLSGPKSSSLRLVPGDVICHSQVSRQFAIEGLQSAYTEDSADLRTERCLALLLIAIRIERVASDALSVQQLTWGVICDSVARSSRRGWASRDLPGIKKSSLQLSLRRLPQ